MKHIQKIDYLKIIIQVVMLQRSVYTIKYKDSYLGGIYQKNRHFVCGFSDKTDAKIVKSHINSENLRLHFDAESSRIIMPLRNQQKSNIHKRKLIVKSDRLMNLAFYLGVNNVGMVLIRNIEEIVDPYGHLYINMANCVDIDIVVNKEVILNKLVIDLSGESYDYNTVLREEINIDRNQFDM